MAKFLDKISFQVTHRTKMSRVQWCEYDIFKLTKLSLTFDKFSMLIYMLTELKTLEWDILNPDVLI